MIQLPAVIEQAGERARRRFVEFFTAEIRNPHTRKAYGTAVARFLAWCEERGLTLERLEPFLLACYVEEISEDLAAPSVKQHLAALRMLFDYLVVGPADVDSQYGGKKAAPARLIAVRAPPLRNAGAAARDL